ncbi:MAG: hypothetical protein B7Y39_09550 [Bdellovibrio sp. 28-41-41]|nr:MAG: hypothetical protein B7Y39_09550 [Bdellovibrio sp. 28-41-41]
MKYFLKFLFSILPTQLRYAVYRRLVKIPRNVPENIVFKIADTTDELESAFKLLHDCYVDVGLMKPDASGMRVTPYHALPSTTTLVAKVQNDVVATLTIIRDSPMGLPCDSFVDLTGLRSGGDRIAEISALAIKRGYRGSLLFYLLKFMYESCVNCLGVDHLIATLTTDSQSNALYESILFFKPIDSKPEINYAFSNFRPVIAEHLNLHEAHDIFKKYYSEKNPKRDLFSFFTKEVFKFNQFPDRRYHMIDYSVMTVENFKYFFIDKSSALKNMPIEKLQALATIYWSKPQIELINNELSMHNVVLLKKLTRKNRFHVCNKNVTISDNGSLFPARLLDVSNMGIRISCGEKISDNFEIIINDYLGKRTHLAVEVKWRNNGGVFGLSVLRADDSWHEMINFFEHKASFDMNPLQSRKSS